MDHKAIASKLAALGKSDLAHLRALERNQAERCYLLTEVAGGSEADLEGFVIEPKDQ